MQRSIVMVKATCLDARPLPALLFATEHQLSDVTTWPPPLNQKEGTYKDKT